MAGELWREKELWETKGSVRETRESWWKMEKHTEVSMMGFPLVKSRTEIDYLMH